MNGRLERQLNSDGYPNVFYTDIDIGKAYEFKVYDSRKVRRNSPSGKNASYWLFPGEFIEGFEVLNRAVWFHIPQSAFRSAVRDCLYRDSILSGECFKFSFVRKNKYVLKIHWLRKCLQDSERKM